MKLTKLLMVVAVMSITGCADSAKDNKIGRKTGDIVVEQFKKAGAEFTPDSTFGYTQRVPIFLYSSVKSLLVDLFDIAPNIQEKMERYKTIKAISSFAAALEINPEIEMKTKMDLVSEYEQKFEQKGDTVSQPIGIAYLSGTVRGIEDKEVFVVVLDEELENAQNAFLIDKNDKKAAVAYLNLKNGTLEKCSLEKAYLDSLAGPVSDPIIKRILLR